MGGRRLCILLGLLHASVASGQVPAGTPAPTALGDVEREVMENIRHQPLGQGMVDDLNLPDEFLRRAADRIIRQTYEERYRAVLPDEQTKEHAPPGEAGSAPSVPAISIRRFQSPTDVATYRSTLREDRPPLRGFRAAIRGEPIQDWPFEWPGDSASPDVRRAAEHVAKRLARDGVLATTAALVDVLGEKMLRKDAADLLRRVGMPVDLLECFGASEHDGSLLKLLWEMGDRRRASPAECDRWLAGIPFVWKSSGFRVALDSGGRECEVMRLQLTRGDYWDGEGDGCSVDIARQLVTKMPDAKFLIHIEDRFVNEFLKTSKNWPYGERGRVTLLPEHGTVGQWAQDNAKVGFAGERNSASALTTTVTLVPRYASRREDGSVFVPGESFLVDRLSAAGHEIRHSRLLFQGGNLISVRDPNLNKLVLLIGEAEIYRNMSLGLTRGQVEEAFRVEFGVDECMVLPAVSYHIDYEVSFREHDKKLTVIVNDSEAAREIVLDVGLECLKAAGVLNVATYKIAKEQLTSRHYREFLGHVMGSLGPVTAIKGGFSASLTRHFSTGPVDSGVGNLQRFLLAVDLLGAEVLPAQDWPGDSHTQAFRRAILRRRDDRKLFEKQLADRGWVLSHIPSLAEEGLSINYVNGIQTRSHYLMPAYGGLFERLDKLAQKVFLETFPKGIAVVPIYSAESQRRVGAVRCSISSYPRRGS